MSKPDPAPGDETEEDLLTRSEASAFLARFGIRLRPASLARLWSTGGNGPPCLHVRHKPLYPRGVLRAWAGSQITGLRSAAPPAAVSRSKRRPSCDA